MTTLLSTVRSGKKTEIPWKRQFKKSLPMLVLFIPGLLYFTAFKYAPLWGLTLAFKDYKPIFGFTGSKWVGLGNFISFFSSQDFTRLIYNTFRIALNNIVFYFPMPILLALAINELKNDTFKRTVQSILYIPHFISWVVLYGLTLAVFGDMGIINYIAESIGFSRQPFLYSEQWFRPMLLFQVIWKESGWGTIIFIAALTTINPELYEAATIDGAGRMRKLWHITLTGIRSTIIVMFILRVGRFLDTGFEQIFLMLNAINRNVGDVFDTFVYETAILEGRYSYAITVSIFKAVVGFTLVLLTDKLAKRLGESGIL